ncbi:hypothetical protein DKX38_015211 [Salix brachista]|uniref:Uncharacterized protein n=1 Tax=Salix brachista TaxID=2182728 RepID=A0A5N5L599_9ROSI|nr:hypothetical protein DKX38_015211 [Salix brachista]
MRIGVVAEFRKCICEFDSADIASLHAYVNSVMHNKRVQMTNNLESKCIAVADGLADVGAESSKKTASAYEFLPSSKGKDEVKKKRKQFNEGEPKLAIGNEGESFCKRMPKKAKDNSVSMEKGVKDTSYAKFEVVLCALVMENQGIEARKRCLAAEMKFNHMPTLGMVEAKFNDQMEENLVV